MLSSFFNSFAASTSFQKYRLEITAKNYDAPSEATIRNLMKTFCSEDPQTKAQIAFATILKKLWKSDSKNSWVYLLKNIIILDRVIEEGVFIEQISELRIDSLQNYKESNSQYLLLDTERLIRTFWKLIKQKSQVLRTKKHIFCYKRSQRQDYLSTLNSSATLKQINSIQNFFCLTFDLVSILSGQKMVSQRPAGQKQINKARYQFSKSKLLQYIYSQLLQKITLYYSCQMMCNNFFIGFLKDKTSINEQELRRFRKHIIKFKDNANQLIRFVDKNKTIKNFEDINYRQYNPLQIEQLIIIIDKLMQIKEAPEPELGTIGNEGIMKVIKSARNTIQEEPRPRKPLKKRQSMIASLNSPNIMESSSKTNRSEENNPFNNWINFYSNQFPQKDMMTVELITSMNQSNEDSDSQPIIGDTERQPNHIYYDLRDTNITVNYQVTLKPQEEKEYSQTFNNIYSNLHSYWNSD